MPPLERGRQRWLADRRLVLTGDEEHVRVGVPAILVEHPLAPRLARLPVGGRLHLHLAPRVPPPAIVSVGPGGPRVVDTGPVLHPWAAVGHPEVAAWLAGPRRWRADRVVNILRPGLLHSGGRSGLRSSSRL